MNAWEKRQQVNSKKEEKRQREITVQIEYVTDKISENDELSFVENWEYKPEQEVYDHFLALGFDITEKTFGTENIKITFNWENAEKDKRGTLTRQ